MIEANHPNAFITKPMYESVENGEINKIPLIIGINSEEQIIKIAGIYIEISLNSNIFISIRSTNLTESKVEELFV